MLKCVPINNIHVTTAHLQLCIRIGLCYTQMWWIIRRLTLNPHDGFTDDLATVRFPRLIEEILNHCSDAIMASMASQITSLTIVYSTVYSDADKRKHQSSVSLAFVRGIHLWPVKFPHKWPVTRKMFPFDDVIMRKSKFRRFTSLPLRTITPFSYAVNSMDVKSQFIPFS